MNFLSFLVALLSSNVAFSIHIFCHHHHSKGVWGYGHDDPDYAGAGGSLEFGKNCYLILLLPEEGLEDPEQLCGFHRPPKR